MYFCAIACFELDSLYTRAFASFLESLDTAGTCARATLRWNRYFMTGPQGYEGSPKRQRGDHAYVLSLSGRKFELNAALVVQALRQIPVDQVHADLI